MKIRQAPEDFVVEELLDLRLEKAGEFRVYELMKRGVDALQALRHVAKSSSVPFNSIGYCGLKDKHALTRQYLSVPRNYELRTLDEPNLKLLFLGYSGNNLSLGDFKANKFTITVRGIRKGELEGVYHKAENLAVPNYFDSQRFGSVVNGDFIIKHVLRNDYETAVKLFLVGELRTDSRLVREDKLLISKSWPDFRGLRLNTLLFERVINEYVKTFDWKKTYEAIPSELRNLFKTSFISYLWNECIKLIIKKNVKKKFLLKREYLLGELIYLKKGFSKVPETFRIGSDDFSRKVLAREGMTINELEGFSFPERKVIVIPQDFFISKPVIDELNGKNNLFKITVSFTLPPGSYATIVLKKIFSL